MKSRLERFDAWMAERRPQSRLMMYNTFSWGLFIGVLLSTLAVEVFP